MKRRLNSCGASSIEYVLAVGSLAMFMLLMVPMLTHKMRLEFRDFRYYIGGETITSIPGGTVDCWGAPRGESNCPDDPDGRNGDGND